MNMNHAPDQVTEQDIEELMLTVIYLTSVRHRLVSGKKANKEVLGEAIESWKGYDFSFLDSLNDKGWTKDDRKSKSFQISEEGEIKAQELIKKFLGKTFVLDRVTESSI